MLVEVIKGGAKREIHDKVAAVLIKQGHVRQVYQTRDMKAAPILTNPLDGMTAAQLREVAAKRGIKVHHRAGADKIREALQTK